MRQFFSRWIPERVVLFLCHRLAAGPYTLIAGSCAHAKSAFALRIGQYLVSHCPGRSVENAWSKL
jgi:hypothetical protein